MFTSLLSSNRHKPLMEAQIEPIIEIQNRRLYFINGMGCELYKDSESPISKHYKNTYITPYVASKNTFNCCFPERTYQTILTRSSGIGIPIQDIRELYLEIDDESIPIIVIIIQDIITNKQVFLFGHSFGGLIVNRLCQEIHKCVTDTDYYKTFIKRDGSLYFTEFDIGKLRENLKNLIVAAFGSIFIPERTTNASINLFNYMLISDVAIRCNYFELKDSIPHNWGLDRNYICANSLKQIDYRYNTPDSNNKVVYLNYFNNTPGKSTPIDTTSLTCSWKKNDIQHQFNVHNKYGKLIMHLLRNGTNDISKLKDIKDNCNEKFIERDDPWIVPGIVTIKEGGKSKRKRKSKIKSTKKRKTSKKKSS